MTKARARERAKARASQKSKKRVTQDDTSGNQPAAGKFDPRTDMSKGPGQNNNAGNFGGARRGAARSK